MIKDLINELKAIDDRLKPIDILIKNDDDIIMFILIYKNIKCFVNINGISIYCYDDGTRFFNHHHIYSNENTELFDLIMLLYNNKEKITEIVLKYL